MSQPAKSAATSPTGADSAPMAISPVAAASVATAAVTAANATMDAKILLTMSSCRLYSLADHRRLLVEGPLVVLEVAESDAYMLAIGAYTIALNPSVPCLVVAPRNFVFPSPTSPEICYGLVLPSNIPKDDEEVLEIILEAASALRRSDSNRQRPIGEEVKNGGSTTTIVASTAPIATPVAPSSASSNQSRASLPMALPLATAIAAPAHVSTISVTVPTSEVTPPADVIAATVAPTAATTTTTNSVSRSSLPMAMAVAAPVVASDTSSSRVSYVAASSSSQPSGTAVEGVESQTIMVTMPVATVPASPSGDRVATVTHSIGNGVEIGGRKLAAGIEAGGRVVGSFVRNSSKFIISKISSNPQPTQVSATTRDRLKNLRVVSGAAVQVSKAIVLGALAGVAHLSARLSDAVGDTSVARKLRDNPSERVDALKAAGRKGIGAVLEVYAALAAAGLVLLEDTKAATVDVVTHRYGAEMGNATDNGLGVATDIGQSVVHLKQAGLKTLAKATVMKTSSELLSDDDERAQLRSNAPVLDPMTAMNAMMAVNSVQQVTGPLFASSSSSSDGAAAATTTGGGSGSLLAPLITAAMPLIMTMTSRPAAPPRLLQQQQLLQQQGEDAKQDIVTTTTADTTSATVKANADVELD